MRKSRGTGFQPVSFFSRLPKTQVENLCHGILIALITAGCQSAAVQLPTTQPASSFASILKSFELDDRLSLCDVWQRPDGSVAGYVEMPQYRDVLKAAGFDVSAVKLLPEDSSTPDRFGVVTAEHAILRKFPKDQPGDRDNVSDLTRGEPVWILDRKADGATLVHASDGYLGWVDAAAVWTVDGATFARRLEGPAQLWLDVVGQSEPLVQAIVDRNRSEFIRLLPGPAGGFEVSIEAQGVIREAHSFIETPYVWGGKSKAGIDCSGLTQTSFERHGVILPRDADQQANVGRLVATRWFKEALAPADLLFYVSPKRGNVHHVALYDLWGRYIEAAGEAVRFRSMKPEDGSYDAKRAATFGWARRVIE